jgi:hypothetical protein
VYGLSSENNYKPITMSISWWYIPLFAPLGETPFSRSRTTISTPSVPNYTNQKHNLKSKRLIQLSSKRKKKLQNSSIEALVVIIYTNIHNRARTILLEHAVVWQLLQNIVDKIPEEVTEQR